MRAPVYDSLVRSFRSMLLVVLCCAGCGGAPARTETASAIEDEVDVPPAAPPASEGTIARAELDATLEAGIGRFLQRVTTEPHLDAGRFVGHRVTELRGELFTGVDLRPGDTLLRINGLPLERPEEAMAIWDALRVASELTIDLLREGERRQLRFAIEE